MPLQFRRGLAADRTSITPVAGEPLYTTDTKKLYIGDGSTAGGVAISASIDGSGTTNTIAYWVDSDTLGALATATYPSLTELSYVKGVTSSIQTQLDGKVDENSAITGATKTKITYDAKGLVTAGADATTADIADSTDKRYVTDSDLTKLSNLSGTNSGDQNLFSTIAVSGQSNVVADSTSDTLTLVAGSNVSITTNATSDEVTISATVPVNGSGTTDQITYWVDSDTLGALSTATYPSLTELSYVKGVTSAIQTQINGKFTLPSLTSGSVLFSDGTTISQDNSNLFWDDTNNRLGIGITTPTSRLDVYGEAGSGSAHLPLIRAYNTSSGTYNASVLRLQNSEGYMDLMANNNSFEIYQGTSRRLTMNSSGLFGFNASTPSAMVHSIRTAEQLRLGYDTSNYVSFTVGTTGTLTIDAVGTGAKFVFSDAVEVPDEAYSSSWNGSVQAPTKNAIYDAIGDITSAGRALIDDADASAQRTTLGLGTLATQNGTFSGTSSGTNTGDQNLFSTVSVSGQSDVVADSTSDTLTLASGTGISITTNATTDTVTIATSGVPTGSGASNKVAFWSGTDTLSSDTDLHWDSTNNRLGIEVTSPTYKLDISADAGGQLQLREQNGTHYLRFNIDDSNQTTISSSSTEVSFDKPIAVPDSAYGAGWNGSTLVPTRNAVYDKIESLGIFTTVAVSGQSNVVADSTSDTLTLVAGSNVTITTDATTDSITISSTASGGIDGSGASNKLAIWSDSDTLTSDTNLHWDTTNDRLGIKTATPNTSLQVAGGTHVTKELAVGLFNWEGDSTEGRIMISGSLGEMSIFDRALSTRTNSNAGDRFVQYNSSKLFRIYTDVNNDILTLSASGSLGLGIGSASASARLHAISTTEQLRLGYDSSNYLTATVSSTGVVTFDAVGSGKSFLFVEPSFTAIPTITTAADGTLTINVANTEFAERTGLTATTTIETTGTAINGQKLIIRLKDNGTSRSLSWNAIFVQGGPSLPTATTAGKWMHLGFIYNSTNSKWMLVASSVEA